MSDLETTVADLRAMVREFVDEREWERFHAPKNVSMAMAIEVAELMEHFQWLSVEESRTLQNDSGKLAAVGEELADVFVLRAGSCEFPGPGRERHHAEEDGEKPGQVSGRQVSG